MIPDPARLPGLLERGRRAAEAAMLDTFEAFVIQRTTVDGFKQDTDVSQGTTKGKVSGTSSDADTDTRTVTVGGVERPVVSGGLHIPLDPMRPQRGWEFVCLAVGPGSDSSLLGRRWRVVDVPAKSHATARRLDVVEVPQ